MTRLLASFVFVLLLPAAARAEPPDAAAPIAPPATPQVAPQVTPPITPPALAPAVPAAAPAPIVRPSLGGGLELWLSVGASHIATRTDSSTAKDDWTASIGLGGIASLRYRLLRVGLIANWEGHAFAATTAHIGLVIGPAWEPDPALRLELLAQAGVDYLYSIGDDLFVSSVTGDSATNLPYAGFRASIAWRFGRDRSGLLGGWFSFSDDLMRRTLSPMVTSCFLGCSTSQEEFRVGGPSIAFAVRVGFEY